MNDRFFLKMLRTYHLLLIIPALLSLPVLLLIPDPNSSQDSPTTTSRARVRKLKRNNSCNANKVLTPHNRVKSYTNSKLSDYDVIYNGNKTFVNKHEKTFERKDLYPSCAFKEEGPVPVLYICNGRSGSSNTWLTLSTLAGWPNEVLETVGSNEKQINEFFDYLDSEEVGSWWVTEHLCETTKYNCQSGIAGFQWKPYGKSITSPAGKGILKKIGSFTIDNGEKIRVLYMTRNPIDVAISSAKHDVSSLPAHCASSDKKCLKSREKVENKMHLPTSRLLKTLQEVIDHDRIVENSLREAGVEYFKTTYEKLYNSEDAEEWMRIFRYFGRGPTTGLSLDDVEKAFPYAKTTKKERGDLLSNFDEVKQLLHGTKFEAYLNY